MRSRRLHTDIRVVAPFLVVLVGLLPGTAPIFGEADAARPPVDPRMAPTEADLQSVVLAGGCFWGMEGIFEVLVGVYDVVSGYSGGSAETAHYDIVGSGTTGHAESVRITFDPTRISYRTLLEVFFRVAHDPTQLNYQWPDIGAEYRSVVFYADEEQRTVAREVITELTDARIFDAPIVTEVVPLDAFYPAEEYHQNFMRNNPYDPYILRWDFPRIAALAREFPELIRSP